MVEEDRRIEALTRVVGGIDSLTWSPDGKSIGFLFVENATRSAGALAAMKPWSGVIGEDGVEIQRVGVIDLASNTWQVTPAKLHVYEFAWSPDEALCLWRRLRRARITGGWRSLYEVFWRTSEIDTRTPKSRAAPWLADCGSTLVA